MTLVDRGRRAEVSDVESVEVVVFRGAKEDGRLQRVENELVDAHLRLWRRKTVSVRLLSTSSGTSLALRGIEASRPSRTRRRRTCIATRPSAFPLRKSYRHTVRSLPLLANTLVSLLLNATQATCSPDDEFDVVWNLSVERGAVFVSSQISICVEPVAKIGS